MDTCSQDRGYPRLAALMSSEKDVAILRRFDRANILCLLSLQSEVMELEKEFQQERAIWMIFQIPTNPSLGSSRTSRVRFGAGEVVDIEAGYTSHSGTKIAQASGIIATVLASVLPVLTILVLNRFESTDARLGVTALFTGLFVLMVATFSDAKRIEIFAATATFSASKMLNLGVILYCSSLWGPTPNTSYAIEVWLNRDTTPIFQHGELSYDIEDYELFTDSMVRMAEINPENFLHTPEFFVDYYAIPAITNVLCHLPTPLLDAHLERRTMYRDFEHLDGRPRNEDGTPLRERGAPPAQDWKRSWRRSQTCISTDPSDPDDEKFCAFRASFPFTTTWRKDGLVIITTPSTFQLLASQHPLNRSLNDPPLEWHHRFPNDNFPEGRLWRKQDHGHKGIGLAAAAPIRPLKTVMTSEPAVMIDDRAVKGLTQKQIGLLLSEMVTRGHFPEFYALSGYTPPPKPEGTKFVGSRECKRKSEWGSPDWPGKWQNWPGEREWKIFTKNAFRTPVKIHGSGRGDESSQQREINFQTVFPDVSRVNHDCSPNMGYYFDSETMQQRLFSLRPIQTDEELTISYIDVTQPMATRQHLLNSTWEFTCTCDRCTSAPHIQRESDDRVEHIARLRKDLDDYSPEGKGTPGKAELLITLFELEGLEVRMYEAYYRAALEWNGVRDGDRAMKHARICLDRGLVLRGEDRPFVEGLRALIKSPEEHWSWGMRIRGKKK
ncbi:hypothetical protein QBC35DRAFT_535841 [Podospora australis]|uniref:SET domain-containing protein n=1 Tax=Podospora australis TaxID=1536484 RepID=A0AAN6WJN9_9PEZI|nr:hypothetical protein QBC35DRAFT_535841 [Podospora australis]